MDELPLRDRILQQATRLFAERGYAGTSVRVLVEACECTKPAIYYHFGSKEELYRAAVDRQRQVLESIAKSPLTADGTVRERVHATIDRFVNHARENPDGMMLLRRTETMPGEAPACGAAVAKATHFKYLCRLLEQGIESGELRSDISGEDAAALILAAVQPRAHHAVDQPACGNVDAHHRLVDLIFEGIAR